MPSRAVAILLAALALATSACASIWGFQTLSTSDDAGVVPDVGSDFDAGNVRVDGSMGTVDAGSLGCPYVPCGNQCVNTMNSRENCGGCNTPCAPGASCQRGSCTCPLPEMVCDGTKCVDFSNDSNNCGGCSKACPPGSHCENSLCVCHASGATPCRGFCVNAYYDTTNCGSCTPTNCGSCPTICQAGVGCEPMGCTCTGATMMCMVNFNLTCTNTNADPSNCGGCGKACPAGADCKNGGCVCTPMGSHTAAVCGAMIDAGVPGACADLTADSNNCGSCGRKCEGGRHCEAGQCVCPSPLVLCGGVCVDVTNDRDNCGGCKACKPMASCVNGACQ